MFAIKRLRLKRFVFVSVAKRFSTSAPCVSLLLFSYHFTICLHRHENTTIENECCLFHAITFYNR